MIFVILKCKTPKNIRAVDLFRFSAVKLSACAHILVETFTSQPLPSIVLWMANQLFSWTKKGIFASHAVEQNGTNLRIWLPKELSLSI